MGIEYKIEKKYEENHKICAHWYSGVNQKHM